MCGKRWERRTREKGRGGLLHLILGTCTQQSEPGERRPFRLVRSFATDSFSHACSFKTAYVTYEEHLVLEDLFGKPDIVAKDLEEAAKRIIEAES